MSDFIGCRASIMYWHLFQIPIKLSKYNSAYHVNTITFQVIYVKISFWWRCTADASEPCNADKQWLPTDIGWGSV